MTLQMIFAIIGMSALCPDCTVALPAETTCAFTECEKSSSHRQRQHFANLTCGIVSDISSPSFDHFDIIGNGVCQLS